MITTIIIFLIVLSFLVFVHELGHFIMARRAGMKVHEFGFGFPPRLFGIQKHEGKWKFVAGGKHYNEESTVYSINAIPLGGFVKIMGEDSEADSSDPKSFVNKSFWQRFATLFAGVAMNFLLAIVLLSIGFASGLPSAVQSSEDIPANAKFTDRSIAIIEVMKDAPAGQAGLQAGDIIKNINGQTFDNVESFQKFLAESSGDGEPLKFVVDRIGEEKSFDIAPSVKEDGKKFYGIGLALYGKMKFGILDSVIQGSKASVNQLIGIATGLWQLVSSGKGIESLGGPVKIAQLTGQVADLGIIPLLQFSALLSLNLALLNALPFPALDGGRMLFLIIEKLRGKKNNPKFEQYANAIGFMALLALMVIITIRDIKNL